MTDRDAACFIAAILMAILAASLIAGQVAESQKPVQRAERVTIAP